MITLSDATDQELQAEIEKRKRPARPIPLDLHDCEWHHIWSYVDDVVIDLSLGNQPPSNFDRHVFEMVIDAMFTSDFWKWWNKQNLDGS